jgi:hypothetical protein
VNNAPEPIDPSRVALNPPILELIEKLARNTNEARIAGAV